MESGGKYRLVCRKATDPETWIVKAICSEKWQAEKFMLNLETCSNMYLEMKITETETEEK